MASDGPGSLFVKSIIAFFVGVTVITVGFLLTIALSLIFGLIYMVASFLRLKCITDRQDKVVEDIFSDVIKGLQATFGFLGEGMVIATQQRRGPNIFSAVAGFLRL